MREFCVGEETTACRLGPANMHLLLTHLQMEIQTLDVQLGVQERCQGQRQPS